MRRHGSLPVTFLLGLVLTVVFLTPLSAYAATPTLLTTWGSSGVGDGGLNGARDLAAAPDGTIYIADTWNHRVQHFSSSGAFLGKWGTQGSGDGQFVSPEGIAVAPDGTVYVSDSGNHRIQHFTAEGGYLGQWGSRGDSFGQFWYPTGVAVASDGAVYVADTYNARIQYFSPAGVYMGQWGSSGTSAGEFQAPNGVAIGSDGTVYVVDPYGSNAQSFTPTGGLIRRFAVYGTQEGQLSSPQYVAVGPDGNVYITDDNVNVFGPDGTFKYRWSAPSAGIDVTSDGNVLALEASGIAVQVFGIASPPPPPAPGSVSAPPPVFAGKWGTFGYVAPGEFYNPMGIAVGPDGNVWVADSNNGRVQGFGATGAPVGMWAGIGGGFYDPQDVAVGPSGRVYVKDPYVNQIQYFSPSGGPSGVWGSVGSGPGQFNNEPYVAGTGIAVNSFGTVYVSDPRNHRIQYFSPDGVYQGEWTTPGGSPEGLAVAPDGTIYTIDTGANRVERFSPTGTFLGEFGSPGSGNGQFNGAMGIAVGPDGSVFVADTVNNRIEQFTATGTYVTQWGTPGTADGQFESPYGVAVAADGTIYVSDFQGRIEYFTPAAPPVWPTTTMTAAPSVADGSSGWYRTVPSLTLTPDRTSDTYYQWDATSPAAWRSYASPIAAPEGAHTVYFYSADSAGNAEPLQHWSFMVDSQPPSVPTLSTGSPTTTSIALQWTAVTDASSGLLRYGVYDADTSGLLANTTSTSWSVTGLSASSTHHYYVVATDIAGNSSRSATIAATTAALPTAPTTIITASPTTPSGLAGWYLAPPLITMSPSRPAFTFYQWDSSAPGGFAPYVSALAPASGTHTLYYFSVDSMNTTETVRSRRFKVDGLAPASPVLSGSATDSTTVNLSWSAVADSYSGLAYYRVIDADTSSVVSTTTATSATLTGVTAGVDHHYTIAAVDAAGNASSPSNSLRVFTGTPHPYSTTLPSFNVRLDFASITETGTTSGTSAPAGLPGVATMRRVGSIVDITTTAAFTGHVSVTVPYNAADVVGSPSNLKLYHYSGGTWRDITTSVDTVNHTVTGVTDSFSPFGLFEAQPQGSGGTPVTSTPASSPWSLALLVIAGVGGLLRRRREDV